MMDWIDSKYQTPEPVCDYMVNMIPNHASKILEPTPGLGNIVKALHKRDRFKIVTADDFFLLNKDEKFDCVIMNPPFSSKSAYLKNAPQTTEINGMKLGYHILRECMEMSDNVIALMPWCTISDSDVRMRHLKEWGIKSLTILPRKTFQYARIQTVIIELEKGFKADTIFHTYKY